MNTMIIDEMKAQRQWMLHGAPGTTGKLAKKPFAPDGGTFSADPKTWTDYETAMANCKRLNYVGVGYELIEDTGIIGVDLDHHFKDGQPDATMKEFMNAIGTAGYWEVSMSGEGVHILLHGSIPNGFNNKPAGVEMYSGQFWDAIQEKYDGTRYLAFTGNELKADLPNVDDPTAALAELFEKYNTATAPQPIQPKPVEYHRGQMLTREQAKEAIHQSIPLENYLQKAHKGLYVCPYCGSGSNGRGSDGALSISKRVPWKWTCFSLNCFNTSRPGKPRSGDVIDLYMQMNHCDFNKALYELADQIGVTIMKKQDNNDFDFEESLKAFNEYGQNSAKSVVSTGDSTNTQPTTENGQNRQNMPAQDYTEYYKECRARIDDPDAAAYLMGRGIGKATIEACQLGYDPAATMLGETTARIIIPVTNSAYIGRRTDLAQDKRVLNSKGEMGLFNAMALYKSNCVFVTEGPFDAMSFLEVGFPAISLNGGSKIAGLLQLIDRKRPKATLVIALDNDEAGKAAAESLQAELTKRNIKNVTFNSDYKDPNEFLVKNAAGFSLAALDAWNRAERPDSTMSYLNWDMAAEIEAFQEKIPTGWRKLDEYMNGGLYSGLYVIGAVSSLGKTSFMLQMADQVAANGTDVIFFSLEQSRIELVSKSLARYAAMLGQDINALTDIRANTMATNERSRQAFDKAKAEYIKRVGNRMNVIEANFVCDVLTIGQYVRDYMAKTGTRPLVIIDYLQILEMPQVQSGMTEGEKDKVKAMQRAGKREQVDYSTMKLKQLSRELSIPIVAICNVSRTNYMVPFDLDSLKESGGIEYSADVVLGLQFHCLNDEMFSKEGDISGKRKRLADEKAKTPRSLDLVCRKNRFGKGSYNLAMDYYPANDLFMVSNQFVKAPNFKQHDANGKYNDLDSVMKTM